MYATVLAVLSGVLLYLSDYPARVWFLQLVAFIPWMLGLQKFCGSMPAAAFCGFCMGVAYSGSLMLRLRFPPPIAIPLVLYQAVLWSLLSIGAFWMLRWPPIYGALSLGCLAVVIEWINERAFPMWGTAQIFARVWSAAPKLIQFISISGMKGIVFVLFVLQALAVAIVTNETSRAEILAAFAAIVIPIALFNFILWNRRPIGAIKVAAIGWAYEQLDQGAMTASLDIMKQCLHPGITSVASQGARLIVTPETGLAFSGFEREMWLARLGEYARQHSAMLAIGYFDLQRNDNRIAFIDSAGVLRGEYVKTHLVWRIETYHPGEGILLFQTLDDSTVSGMICHDDNFARLPRRCGKKKARIVAVPTNDWREVKDYHFEASILRAIECGYAIVRATSNGVSAIVAANGRIIARRDHFSDGSGPICAEIPLYEGGTIYSWFGGWFEISCALATITLCAWRTLAPAN